jgi:hypothetical protein
MLQSYRLILTLLSGWMEGNVVATEGEEEEEGAALPAFDAQPRKQQQHVVWLIKSGVFPWEM